MKPLSASTARVCAFPIMLALWILICSPGQAAAPKTFFSQSLASQANQVMRAAGCLAIDHMGNPGNGEMFQCSTLRNSGIPRTTNLMLFGPQPLAKTPGALSEPEDVHVFVEWNDSAPGTGFLPAHTERREAEVMLRGALDVIGVRDKDSVVRAFFAEVRRNGHAERIFKSDALKIVVRIEDGRSMVTRRLFVSEATGRIPGPTWEE